MACRGRALLGRYYMACMGRVQILSPLDNSNSDVSKNLLITDMF